MTPLPILIVAALYFLFTGWTWLITLCDWPVEMRAAAGELTHHVPSAIDALHKTIKRDFTRFMCYP